MTALPDTAAFQVVRLRHQMNKGRIAATYEQSMRPYDTDYQEFREFVGPLAAACLHASSPEDAMRRIVGMTAQVVAVAVELAANAEPGEERKPDHLPPAVLEVIRTARAAHLAAQDAFLSDAEGLLQATDPQAMRDLWKASDAANDKLGEALRDLEAAGTDTA